MIIGEQRVNENNYYENSHQQSSQPPPTSTTTQYEVLKRKLSSENDSECKNVSDKSCSSSSKMQYIENIITDYHTYQTEQIHQDGDQSYINLTVLTPSMVHYDKNTITIHPPNDHSQNFIINCHESQQHPQQQQQQHHVQDHHHQNIQLSKQHVTSSVNIGRNYQQQQPNQQQQTDNGEDNEDKNLSWLFNFKLDEIANLSPEIKRKRTNNNNNNSNNSSHNHHHNNNQQHTHVENHQNFYNNANHSQQPQQSHYQEESNHQRSLTKDPCIEDDLNVAENIVISSNTPSSTTTHTPKKPPFTYTELIEYALEDKGELTVSGIYQWISDRFPYYKSNDDRWKNSVRHNLSINPHFRKGNKAKAGAGHLWKISSRESEANFLAWEHKKQRLELFFKMEAANNLKHQKKEAEVTLNKISDNIHSPTYEAELNAATASIISLPIDTNNSPLIATHGDFQLQPDSPISGQLYLQEVMPISTTTHPQQQNDDLRRAAGEILNGVRRNVEVQIMHPNDLQTFSILNAEDYLNPISKEEIMQESGLGRRHDEFYLIDPGIAGTDESTEVFEIFHEDFNLSYFGNNCIA